MRGKVVGVGGRVGVWGGEPHLKQGPAIECITGNLLSKINILRKLLLMYRSPGQIQGHPTPTMDSVDCNIFSTTIRKFYNDETLKLFVT